MITTLYAMNGRRLATPADESIGDLLSEEEICQKLPLPIPTFRQLRRRGLIPYLKFGYRTFRYDIVAVRRALNSLEVKAVAA
jgi:hypothetical protein